MLEIDETVKAVVWALSFSATMALRFSRLASSRGMGVQTIPEVWRTMKAIFSGVHGPRRR